MVGCCFLPNTVYRSIVVCDRIPECTERYLLFASCAGGGAFPRQTAHVCDRFQFNILYRQPQLGILCIPDGFFMGGRERVVAVGRWRNPRRLDPLPGGDGFPRLRLWHRTGISTPVYRRPLSFSSASGICFEHPDGDWLTDFVSNSNKPGCLLRRLVDTRRSDATGGGRTRTTTGISELSASRPLDYSAPDYLKKVVKQLEVFLPFLAQSSEATYPSLVAYLKGQGDFFLIIATTHLQLHFNTRGGGPRYYDLFGWCF
jgi:hypothetical protein